MKKETGFTLVELLAVIVILAIILIIAVPGVLSIINKTKDNALDRQKDMMKEAARTYVTTGTPDWRDNRVVVNLSDLQALGLLDKKLINPRDKSEMKGISVLVTRSGNRNNYEIVYSDSSNANYPVYSSNMIPIVWNGSTWVKADSTNENQSWFDYTKQQWANVATVTEDVRDTFVKADPGVEIPMDKINTMFVWVPKFKYKLFNVDGTVSPVGNSNMVADYTIDVVMEGRETPKSIGTQNGEYLTHPAFTFGTEELSGFWIGKFELGYKDARTTEEAEQTIIDSTKVIVKPNSYSWRHIAAYDIYSNIKGMMDVSEVFGFSLLDDPHLIKNVEWGAMSYLGASIYGKAGNSLYEGVEKEVRINNNNTYLTGCGADSQGASHVSSCNTYETDFGQAASTTGNITGIYDTSGGAWDLVAGIQVNEDHTGYQGGYGGFPEEELNRLGDEGKYFDTYELTTSYYDMSQGHLGDATIEMGPFLNGSQISSWYTDGSRSLYPPGGGYFVYRGENWIDKNMAGLFAFGSWAGNGRHPDSRYVTGRVSLC